MFGNKKVEETTGVCYKCKHIVALDSMKTVYAVGYNIQTDDKGRITNWNSKRMFCPEHAPKYDVEVSRQEYAGITAGTSTCRDMYGAYYKTVKTYHVRNTPFKEVAEDGTDMKKTNKKTVKKVTKRKSNVKKTKNKVRKSARK